MANERNKPCHCGSGKKYKQCHLPIEQAAAQAQRETSVSAVVDTRLLQALRALDRKLSALPAAGLMSPGGDGDLVVLRWLLEELDPRARHKRLYAHPRMFVSGVIEALRGNAVGAKAAARALLDYAEKERSAAEQNHVRFPLSYSPIVRLANGVGSAQASDAQMILMAATPLVASTISMPYLRWLGDAACKKVTDKSLAIRLGRLLLAATGEGLVQDDRMRVQAAVEFVDIVKVTLGSGPDGPLLAEAARIGGDALAVARADGSQDMVAKVLFALGTLYMDPYTADFQLYMNRSSGEVAGYAEQIAQWQRSEGRPSRPGPTMPPAEQALATAVGYLRECCTVATGGKRGHARKALAQTLLFQTGLGETADDSEIDALIDGALEDLGPESGTYDVTMLLSLRAGRGGLTSALNTPAFSGSLADLERRSGSSLAAGLVLAEVERLKAFDPAQALALIREAAALFRRAGEKDRNSALMEQIRLLVLVYEAEPVLSEAGPMLADRAERLLARASQEGWDRRRQGAALIALAATAQEFNEEAAALQLLERVRAIAPALAHDHAECLDFLRATLLLGAGVNDFGAGSWRSANDNYSAAIDEAMKLGLDGLAYELVARVADVVRHGSSATGLALATQLAPRASLLEARLGVRATDTLQRAYKQALSELTVGAVPADSVLALLQLAKGRRFASVVSNGTRYHAENDEEGTWILNAIGQARLQLAAEQRSTDRLTGTLTEEVLVATYADAAVGDPLAPTEAAASTSAHLAELQHRYDAYLSEQLLPGAGGGAPLLTTADVQAALDSQTVLIDLFAGRGPANDVAIYLLALTRESVEFAVVPQGLQDGEFDVMGDAAHLRTSQLGERVAEVRRALQEPPLGRRQVALSAAGELERFLDGLLGPVATHLASYRDAGKSHLCFVPHGPLHYLPFHLLGAADLPLAAEWTVTYLPNLQLLRDDGANVSQQADRMKPIAAFGLGFGSDWHGDSWPPLHGAVPEAHQVAELFGEQATVGEAATARAVLRALTDARMVHIATHGTYDAFAPAFQSLELSPAAKSDGKLRAYELLGLDLRGLELVTLSACQTALGRFDAADNIRGLPASLLLGGASSVIGTLWPVRDDVARFFFVELYSALREGSGRLDAFRAAQIRVRQEYPQHRHWGCFYYAGRW